ncbi:hypothetical protein [Faecalibaculum rodentium]|jgi:hypothetical protein|uniref:hypothetical protein n=1 Tax=Faecalibaculum rodentium TaxID=1702221 RepID=UPI0025ADF5FA|nr:hypothetical protein [Faecalibaculum rodentium]
MKKTQSGFEYTLDRDYSKDWEMMEMLMDVESNPLKLIPIVKQVLGPEQYPKFKEHCRRKDGVVDAEMITEELMEIIAGGPEKAKKS